MQVTIGEDRSLWRECRSLFPCGTPYGTEDLSELARPPRDLARAKRTSRIMNASASV